MRELWEIRYVLAGWGLFALWMLSLMLPVTEHGQLAGPGIIYLLMGWGGILTLQFAWLANPLLMFAILYGARSRAPNRWVAILSAGALCALAASAMFYHRLASPDGGMEVIPSGPGFYVWLVAVLGGAVLVLTSSIVPRERLS